MKVSLTYLSEGKRPYIIIFLCTLIYMLGLGQFRLFDWDEINFAESAREMLVTGDFFRTQINFETFWEKPPFFFWLQAASMKLFGVNEFAARFPNALFGGVYLLTLFLIGKKEKNKEFGLVWMLVFFVALLPFIYFKSGIIDPVFNYFIFLSIYFLYRTIRVPADAKWPILSGLFSALSVVTKGPVGFLLLALTFGVRMLIKKFKEFPGIKHFALFFVGFLGITSIWVLTDVSQNGWDNLRDFFIYQIDLFNKPVAGHGQPFYYHFIVLALGCFPMVVWAIPRLWKVNPEDSFAGWMRILFWVVLILFSVVTTKIIHYSSMCYLPLSFLAAKTLYEIQEEKASLPSWMNIWNLVQGLILSVGIIGMAWIFINSQDFLWMFPDAFTKSSMNISVEWMGWEPLVGLLLASAAIFSFLFFKRSQNIKGLFVYAVGLPLTLVIAQFTLVPQIEKYTQGPMLDFVEKHGNENHVVHVYAFKSYADFFYGQAKPEDALLKSSNKNILNMPSEKEVYVVCRIDNNDLDTNPQFKSIGQKGGWKFYKRLF